MGRKPVVNHGNVIGAGIRVEGSVRGTGELDIEGQVSGSVELNGDLGVHTGAEVEGTISATSLEVTGTIRGPVTAQSQVSIGATGVIEGDITAPEITVDPKARVTGRFEMPIDLPRGLGAKSSSITRR